jgi:hypothetical protein
MPIFSVVDSMRENERREKIRNNIFMNFITSRTETWSVIEVKLENVEGNNWKWSVFYAVVDKSYTDVR